MELLVKRRIFPGAEPDAQSKEPGTAEARESTAEAVFALYKNAMYRTAYDVLRDEWQAEDAVMDALAKICADPERFTGLPEKKRRLLVMRTVENCAIDRWRRGRRIREHEEPCEKDDELPGEGSAEDSVLAEGDAFGTLTERVRRLPEAYREVILLRYGEDYTNREIAEMLSIPESTVATRLDRARKLLKKQILEEENQ